MLVAPLNAKVVRPTMARLSNSLIFLKQIEGHVNICDVIPSIPMSLVVSCYLSVEGNLAPHILLAPTPATTIVVAPV